MDQDELIKYRIKSSLIVLYVSTFSELEKKIKKIFQERILEKEHKHKSKLYFAYGCMVGNEIYYDFEKESLLLTANRKYKDEELFGNMNINKIIKFDRREHLIDDFTISINSIQTKTLQYSFHDAVLKLVEMRNVLAHEIDNINFKQQHIIESLSIEHIRQNSFDCLEGLDINRMDNDSISIYSNIVYMQAIITALN